MPITLAEFTDTPNHHGHEWTITDEIELARLVALLVLGHHTHVSKVISELSDQPVPSHDAMLVKAIDQLSEPETDPLRWHRDGWVFQMISWIAASLTITSQVAAIRAPHARPADKGQDGLIVYLSPGADAVHQVVVCEDKATERPRNTITSKVWPELVEYESGSRDAEIVSDLQIALGQAGHENIHDIIKSVHWDRHRCYRLGITALPEHNNQAARMDLFQGYNDKVSGDINRRCAEVILFEDIRAWMDEFCTYAIGHLNSMRECADV